MFAHGIHSWLTRWMYFLITPTHPHGYVDLHAVIEEDETQTLWVHTHGLQKFQLPEIELIGVPNRLRGYAHGNMFSC